MTALTALEYYDGSFTFQGLRSGFQPCLTHRGILYKLQDHSPINAYVCLQSLISLRVVQLTQGLQNDIPCRVLEFRGPTRELYTFRPSASTNDEELLKPNLLRRLGGSCLWQLIRTRRGGSSSGSFGDLGMASTTWGARDGRAGGVGGLGRG